MVANRDAAVAYGAVFASVGPMFNEYAGADIANYTGMMDRVLALGMTHIPCQGQTSRCAKGRAQACAAFATIFARTQRRRGKLERPTACRTQAVSLSFAIALRWQLGVGSGR